MSDAFPQTDSGYDEFVNQFVPYVAGHAAALGVPTATAAALTTGLEDWSDNYNAHKVAQTAALAATAVKEAAKTRLTALVRPVARMLQANPVVNDDAYRGLGLPLRDTIRTRAAVPTSRPVVSIDTSERLRHIMSWRDEATPKSKLKPKGVVAAEIWCYIGTAPPTGPEQFKLVALDTATPYLLQHASADAGKSAYYNLRWANIHHECGPWSETVSATITG